MSFIEFLKKEKDSDNDGLSDKKEKSLGTNPCSPDTDGDGLCDYEEANIFKTDPLNPDTDSDGISDGDEVRMGRNPKGLGTLKDLFIPNENNNYKPKALEPKRIAFYGISSVIIKIIVIVFVAFMPISAWLTPDVMSGESQKIIQLTNSIRSSLNVALLTQSSILNSVAFQKAQDMLVSQYFAHVGPDGKDVGSWLNIFKYSYEVAGENLAMGFSSAEDVVNGWTRSKTHYANLIDPDFTEIGVGMSSGKFEEYDTTFVAQIFAKPKVAAVVKPTPIPVEPKPEEEGKQVVEEKEEVEQVVVPKTTTPTTQSKSKIKAAPDPEEPIKASDGPMVLSVKERVVLEEKIKQQTQEQIAQRIKEIEEEKARLYQDTSYISEEILTTLPQSLTTNQSQLDFTVLVLGANNVFIYDNEELLWQKELDNSELEVSLNLNEGEHNLRIKAEKLSGSSFSKDYFVTVDQTAPTVDMENTRIYVDEPEGKNQKVVRVEAYLSYDVEKAQASFGNYYINLYPETGTNKWTGQVIIFNQDTDQIFNPVVLANIRVVDKAGNTDTVDITWDNIVPSKASLLNQYFFIKGSNLNFLKPIFNVSSIFYKILLAIAALALVLSVFIKIKKQYPYQIISTLALIFLLIILIIV